jgi:hypothetical protein
MGFVLLHFQLALLAFFQINHMILQPPGRLLSLSGLIYLGLELFFQTLLFLPSLLLQLLFLPFLFLHRSLQMCQLVCHGLLFSFYGLGLFC